MRGLKDEEKVVSPMFPRLHVNDTEKGGPRAPPRNKMALYEQLSVPSQRFSSGSSPMPLPHNESSLVPAMSSSHGVGCERSGSTPLCTSPAPSHSEKPFSQSVSEVKLSNKMASPELKSMDSRNYQSLNKMQQLPLSVQCKSFKSHNFSNFKSLSMKKQGEENDLHCSSGQQDKDQENQLCWNLTFSKHFQNVPENQKKGTGFMNLKASDPSIQDKPSADMSSSPSGKVKSTESLKRAHPSSNQEDRIYSMGVLRLNGKNIQCQNFVAMQDKTVCEDNFLVESAGVIGKKDSSKVISQKCHCLSLGDAIRSHNGIENGSTNQEDKQKVSLQVGNAERHDDVSETSTVDSMSAVDISTDDVVRVIGEKQFWEARRAILNQQRVFTVQVFELHRIVKVQKLIAGSPDVLLEGNIYLGKAPFRSSLETTVPSEKVIAELPLIVKPKDSSKKQYASAEFADENAVGKLLLPSVNNGTGKGLLTQQSNYMRPAEGALPAPLTGQSPWCFPPPGNHWLFPVMSPSEGLVYKPYTGPCPPTAGFVAPVHGNCDPMRLTSGGGDFFNAAYGVQQGMGILTSTPHLGHAYFPPYGMSVMTPSIAGSAVEQMNPLTGPQSKDNQLSVGDINVNFPHQSSCNLSSQMTCVMSRIGKFRASKKSEVKGSIASSPSERPKGDELPLFPTEPTAQASDQNAENIEPQTCVIRVVPHNPKSATESAARIFQSIQEERKQYD